MEARYYSYTTDQYRRSRTGYLSIGHLWVLRLANSFRNPSSRRGRLFVSGRFGSGLTGISFTDPQRLKNVLNIDHSFDMRPELSSEFIYEVIEAFGTPKDFFSSFF